MRGQLELPPDDIEAQLIQHSLSTLEGGLGAGSALIERDCTAIVCASDMMAFGAIRVARQRGLDVPRALSVVASATAS